MENIIYNELLCRGYSADVGVVEIVKTMMKPWIDEEGILASSQAKITT